MALTGKITNLFADKAMTIPAFPRTKVKAVSDDNGVGLNVLLDSKQEKSKSVSISLFASNWSDMTQAVVVSGVTEDNTVIVTPDPINYIVYGEAGVYCSAQGNNTLTFTCSAIPAEDLVVNVLILD